MGKRWIQFVPSYSQVSPLGAMPSKGTWVRPPKSTARSRWRSKVKPKSTRPEGVEGVVRAVQRVPSYSQVSLGYRLSGELPSLIPPKSTVTARRES